MAKSKKTRKLKFGPKRRRPSRSGKATPAQQQAIIREAANWPVIDCLVAEEWREPGAIIQVLVARRSPTGYIAVASLLVDLGCLGVKDGLTAGFASEARYRQEMRSRVMSSQPMIECDLDFVAKLVNTATEYADSLGFKPHPDAQEALALLQGAKPENCAEEIPVGGEDGQPLFIAGPHDDVARIMATLNRSVGAGNYHYIAPLSGPFDEMEDW